MQIYLVGGAVRDMLLGLPIKDKDFVVVGSTTDDMMALGFSQVGKDFPVFLHPDTHHEYALARTERKNGTGYQGFATHTANVSLKDDLLRRDLTINALAIEVNGLFDDTPKTGQVIDFYGGIQDLQDKTLRHISPAFCEDPLRILRTVRLLARYHHLGFKIADETICLIQQMAQHGELTHLSRERLWTESVKAMESGTGHYYWQFLKEFAILPYFLKELDECWQDELVFNHTIQSLTLAKNETMAVQFAILCHLIHRGITDNQLLIKQVSQQLNTPKYPIQIANLIAEFHQFFNKPAIAKDVINLIEKTKAHQGNISTLQDTLTAIFIINHYLNIHQDKAQDFVKQAIQIYQSVNIDDIDKSLKGKEIGLALNKLRKNNIQQLLDEYAHA